MNEWKIETTQQVKKFFDNLSSHDQAKIKEIFLLFGEYGVQLSAKYFKRISGTKELWELRAKRIRILMFIVGNKGIGVHGFIKKTQKTPKKDIDLAIARVALIKEIYYEKENSKK